MRPDEVDRVFCCSGKIYFELVEERKKRQDTRTAIIRVEQLYPLQDEDILATFRPFPKLKEIVWVQDEPANMGAFRFALLKLRRLFPNMALRGATRVESASPATGSSKAHVIEQRALMDEAFGPG